MMPRLLIALAAVCFATTGTAQALGAAGASPVTVGEARIVVGALALQVVARLGARAGGGRADRIPAWPRTGAMWLAAAGVAGYQVAFFLAVRLTGVAVGTVVALGSAPVVTGALAAAFRQGRPDARWAGATALAGAGLAVLVLGGRGARLHPLGVLLAVCAAAGYAAYTLVAKRALAAGERPEAVMAGCFTGGAVLLSPALVLLPAGWLATPRGALTALWLGLVPTALAYVLFARGLQGVSAAEASTLTLAEPLTAAVLGVLVLGEHLTAASATGAGLLLAGLAVLGLPGRHHPDAAPSTPTPATAPATAPAPAPDAADAIGAAG